MNGNVAISELKNAMAVAVAKVGTGTRADAIESVLKDALTIRRALNSDADYIASKKAVESQKKTIDACTSIIKDGMHAVGLKEFESDGMTVKFKDAKRILLSEVAKANPQAVLDFIKSGGLDGASIKLESIESKRLKELIQANTEIIEGAIYFKD